MNWIAYTLMFSFLPIILLFILAKFFGYDSKSANLENLFILDCGLAVAVWRDAMILRDTIEGKIHGACVQYLMIWACIISSTFFSGLCITQGADISLKPEITRHLQYAAVALLFPIAGLGIGTQICIGVFSGKE